MNRVNAGHWRSIGAPLLIILATLIAWQLLTVAFEIPVFLLPPPSTVAPYLVLSAPELFDDIISTLTVTIAGFALGTLAGFILSLGMANIKAIERSIYPYVLTLRIIPTLSFAPLFLVWFGFNVFPLVLMAASTCFFSVVVNGLAGLRSTNRTTLEMMASLNASRLQVIKYVRLYDSLPYLFAGLKSGITLALVGAVVGEFVIADRGLGFQIVTATHYINTRLLFSAVLYVSLMGLALFATITLLESRVLRWKRLVET